MDLSMDMKPGSFAQRISKHLTVRKNNFLSCIVRGRIHSGEQFFEALSSMGVSMPHRAFAFIAFEVENAANLFFEEHSEFSEDMWDHILYIINNMGEELFNEKYHCLIGETGGLILCLINVDPTLSKETVVSDLTASTHTIYDVMKTSFGVTLSAEISSFHTDISGIITCYEEIREIVEWRNWILEEQPLILYQEIASETEPLSLSRLENNAITAIKAHAYKDAIVILQSIETEIHRSKQDDSKNVLPSSSLARSISAYILENYRDSNLSAGTIAEHFGLSASSLSQLFKKNVDSGVLDEIHRLRIQSAKNLLLEGNTVQDTANMVGYCNTRTMIRAFKRLVGMTPTEYKESHPRERKT